MALGVPSCRTSECSRHSYRKLLFFTSKTPKNSSWSDHPRALINLYMAKTTTICALPLGLFYTQTHHIRAPLDYVKLDERDCVRHVYAAIIEQIYNPARLVSKAYIGWVGANISALCEIAEYYGVDCHEDGSVPDFTSHEEQVALFQRLVFHFINMVQDVDALMTTCNKVWKMTKLTPKQLCAEGERLRAAVYQKKSYEVSEETLVEIEKCKGEKKTLVKKVVKMMKW